MVEIAAGSLAIQAAKAAYDVWRQNRSDAALDLTDGARAVLKSMQSDDTGNGILLDMTGIGGGGAFRLRNPYHAGELVKTTRRVVTELDAKGLVEPYLTESGRGGIKLTHLGWILNPETGKADKVG